MGLEGKADTDTSKGTCDLPLFLAAYSTITHRSSAVGPFAELASTEDLLRSRSTSLYKLQPFCKSIEAITHNINIHRLESMNCLNSDYPLWSTSNHNQKADAPNATGARNQKTWTMLLAARGLEFIEDISVISKRENDTTSKKVRGESIKTLQAKSNQRKSFEADIIIFPKYSAPQHQRKEAKIES